MPAIVLVCCSNVGNYNVQLYIIKRTASKNIQEILNFNLTYKSVYILICSHLKTLALAYNTTILIEYILCINRLSQLVTKFQ